MTDDGNGTKWVNTRLDRSSLADLEGIQVHHGIKSRSDTIRYLIRAEARRLEDVGPSVRDLLGAHLAGLITAEEVIENMASRPELIGAGR